ncbi:MAG: hypothetical protein IID05_04970 [Gemmatimonadetes bacterium]|nr:hypothetical protein [Gemmatimonadota bacterium]
MFVSPFYNKITLVRSCNGVGKTEIIAEMALGWLDMFRSDCKVILSMDTRENMGHAQMDAACIGSYSVCPSNPMQDQIFPDLVVSRFRLDDAVEKVLDALDAAIDAVGPDTIEGKAVAKQKARLEPDTASLKKKRIQEVSQALVMACNNLRLPVSVKKAKRSGGSSDGSVGRLPRAELEAACQKILKTLPSKSGKYLNGAEVAKNVDLTPVVLRSALSKLKRDGLAVTNGKKGMAGGYRKA